MSEKESTFDEMFAELGERQESPAPARDADIKRECTTALKPVSSLSRGQRITACATLSLLVLGSLSLIKYNHGGHQLAQGALYGTCGWSIVLLILMLVGFGPQGSSTRRLRVVGAFGVPLLFFGYLAVFQNSWLSLPEFFAHKAHGMSALRCGARALILGVISAGGVLYVWRRTDPFNPQWSGALAGLVGGLSGALSIGLVCPGDEGWHLWLGHGLSVVALVLVGATIGRRLLAP